MDLRVGVRRAVVQDELRRAAAGAADRAVDMGANVDEHGGEHELKEERLHLGTPRGDETEHASSDAEIRQIAGENDGDGDADLALAADSGPLRILFQEKDRFTDHTEALGLAGHPHDAADDFAAKATAGTRLAYVTTGNAEVDAISKAGLQSLTVFLGQRTALEAGEPMGLDIGRDELAFFPIIHEISTTLGFQPLALLIGFALDQQVTVPTAFLGPLKLQQRLGHLDAGRIALTARRARTSRRDSARMMLSGCGSNIRTNT